MTHLLRSLLLAAALLFAQHAALLHDLSHARHDAAIAEHGVDECIAYFSLAHALGSSAIAPQFAGVLPGLAVVAFESPAVPPRIVFDSRAPPFSV